jgi:hypothetical protein
MKRKTQFQMICRDRDWDHLIKNMKKSSLRNINMNRDELYSDQLRRLNKKDGESVTTLN